jgi:hypothetical protein
VNVDGATALVTGANRGLRAARDNTTITNQDVLPVLLDVWSLAAAVYPGFDSYQGFTERQVPVAVLERRAADS